MKIQKGRPKGKIIPNLGSWILQVVRGFREGGKPAHGQVQPTASRQHSVGVWQLSEMQRSLFFWPGRLSRAWALSARKSWPT